VAIVSSDLGSDAPAAQQLLSLTNDLRDPYPWLGNSFLMAQGPALLQMDEQGRVHELYRLTGELAAGGNWLHEPRPLRQKWTP